MGCINAEGQEDRTLNSVPIQQEFLVLRRKQNGCPGFAGAALHWALTALDSLLAAHHRPPGPQVYPPWAPGP